MADREPALAPHARITVSERPSRAMLRIEWHPSADVATAFRGGLAVDLCPVNRSAACGSVTVLRIGPHALWAVSDEIGVDGIAAFTEPFVRAVGAAAVDVGHGFVALACSGPDLADLLQAGTPADVADGILTPGDVVRTVFDAHPVTIHCRGAGAVDLYVDRSLAHSFRQRFRLRAS